MLKSRYLRYLSSLALLVTLLSLTLAGPLAQAGSVVNKPPSPQGGSVCPTPAPRNGISGSRGQLISADNPPAAQGSAHSPSDYPAWEAFSSLPGPRGRMASAFWPANGHIYAFGGRNSDSTNDYSTYLISILEGDPGSGTWTTKSAIFPTQNTSNMEAAVLTPTSGIPAIYILGASGPGAALTNTMYIYNPTADSLSTVVSDTWPVDHGLPRGGRVPGGSAVYNNKWYIFGGIRPAQPGGYADTWVYDPTAPLGSRWTNPITAQLSIPRGFIAGATLDGKIYAVGGGQLNQAGTALTNEPIVERLDPSAPSPAWTRVADLPIGRSTAKAYAWDTGSGYPNAGHVIVAGGFWNVGSNAAYIYDPIANSWSGFANLVNVRRNYGATQGNGVFYALGGYNAGGISYRSDNERYPAVNPPPSPTPTFTPVPGGQWQVNQPLNVPRLRVGSATAGNNVYVIGGLAGNCYDTQQNANESFNLTTNTWTVQAAMPTARGAAATAADNGTIYAVGGIQGPFENGGGTYLNTNQSYDVAANTWMTRTSMPAVTSGGAGAALNGKFYVIAGDHNVSPYVSNTNYIYDEDANSWNTGATLPTQTAYGAAAVLNGLVYHVGGYNGSYTNVINGVYAYDPAANTWMTKAHMLVARQAPTAFALNGELWVVGGGYFRNSQDGGFTPITQTQSVEIYNPSTDSWRYGPSLNFTRLGEGGGAVNNLAVIAAGFDGASYTTSAETISSVILSPTPTVTGTPPTPTQTPTITNTPLPSPTPCGIADAIANGSFESGSFAPWVVSDTNPLPIVTADQAYSGSYSALLGNVSGPEPDGDGSIYQTIQVPAAGGMLSYWYWPYTEDTITFDWQDAYIENTSGAILATIMHVDESTQAWTNVTFNMTPYAGQTVRLVFLVHQDGFGDNTGMYVDAVSLPTGLQCPTLTRTPTPATTNTPTRTATPAPTNTPTRTATPLPTNTPMPPTSTPAPSATPTDCPNPFVDINGNVFYYAIHYLYCRGAVNGTDPTHYSPAGTATRGQFAKVVVLGFAIPLYTPGGNPDFTDVPAGYFAYVYIETLYHYGITSGFDPPTCIAHGVQPPCYLPNIPISRGQLTKFVVLAGNCPFYTPSGGGQDFIDVPPSNVFYVYIETAYHAGVINGYPDTTFRPNLNIRRDEMAQIVYEGILHCPGLMTPTPAPPTVTPGAMVSAQDFRFNPLTTTVSVGTTVMWMNTGATAHTVNADDDSWSSPNLNPGDTYYHTFTAAGSFGYYCRYHGSPSGGGMHGTVVVTP
ncbi:MAG: hypothetical protein DLM69_10920 [Candidatus Chloroheliales bacterium]|nr:MAG: hypothetical protein DLM69_10920 [Chloroflexota bacterium]